MPAASVANPTLSHTVTESFHLEDADGARQETKKLSLKLYMNGSGEDRELRCELTPALHDADVYYTCSVRRAALPELKRKFHLGEYDFDGLIRIIISQLQYSSSSSPSSVASSSTQSERSVNDHRPTFFCLRTENGDKCQIQVLHPGGLSRQTLPFELRALRGDQLCRFFHSTLQSTTAKLYKEEKKADRLEASLKEMRRLHKEKEAVLEATKAELEEERNLKEGLMNEVEENKIELDRLQKVEDELSDELERMELQAADHREECIDPDELRRAREEADNMRRQNVRLKDDLERSQNAVRKAEDRAAEEAKRRRNMEEQLRRLLQKEMKKVPDAPSASPHARPPPKTPKTGGRAICGYVLAEDAENNAAPSSEDKENDQGPPSLASSCSSAVSSSPQKLRELEADLKEKTELLLKVMDKERTLSEALKECEQDKRNLEESNAILRKELEDKERITAALRARVYATASTHQSPVGFLSGMTMGTVGTAGTQQHYGSSPIYNPYMPPRLSPYMPPNPLNLAPSTSPSASYGFLGTRNATPECPSPGGERFFSRTLPAQPLAPSALNTRSPLHEDPKALNANATARGFPGRMN